MQYVSRLMSAVRTLGIAPHTIVLAAGDLAALLGTACVVFFLRSCMDCLPSAFYTRGLPLLLLAPLLGAACGVYQRIAPTPHRELKRLAQFVTLLYVLALALLFFSKSSDTISRIFLVGAWACSLITVPVMRYCIRRHWSRMPWWGTPLVILDYGGKGKEFWRWLKCHPERDLVPVCLEPLPEQPAALRQTLSGLCARFPGALALLPASPDMTQGGMDYLAEVSACFPGVIYVPPLPAGQRRQWFTVQDLGMAVGLLARRRLHDKWRQCVKRALDVTLTLLGMPVVLPVGAVICAAIVLSSPGSPFYCQRRIGRDGRKFTVYKFRSMVRNADALLQRHLASSPELRAEWEADQKLRNDPRIFPVGRLLRKTSLDELPQLINVLKGDMSLVGPRPIVTSEIAKYGPVFDDYCRVRPGITGFWQVSGRNDTTYEDRVAMDQYYVSNWSVWLDIWILAKTLPAVLHSDGAY
ncbi:MAG: undecaprenyl-phosphate galactose phosphotransferase WbaP [Desulfovibrionaceae bacterium]|nr:undecaprenyl-phosphate galactose phosphotransferase WbaP [Desulfovibrionaceae bacterium]